MKNTMKEITLNEMERIAGGEDNRPEPKYALGQYVLFDSMHGKEEGTILNMYYSQSQGCWLYEFGVYHYEGPYDSAYIICSNYTEEDIIRVL